MRMGGRLAEWAHASLLIHGRDPPCLNRHEPDADVLELDLLLCEAWQHFCCVRLAPPGCRGVHARQGRDCQAETSLATRTGPACRHELTCCKNTACETSARTLRGLRAGPAVRDPTRRDAALAAEIGLRALRARPVPDPPRGSVQRTFDLAQSPPFLTPSGVRIAGRAGPRGVRDRRPDRECHCVLTCRARDPLHGRRRRPARRGASFQRVKHDATKRTGSSRVRPYATSPGVFAGGSSRNDEPAAPDDEIPARRNGRKR